MPLTKRESSIVFFTKDLMIQSNASATAKRLGVSMISVGNVESACKKLNDDSAIGLFVDLQTPGLDIQQLASEISSCQSKPKTIAFAQHVETDLLDVASSGVFDAVLTRGQFNHRLPGIIQEMVGEARL